MHHAYHTTIASEVHKLERYRVPPRVDLTDCRCSPFVLVRADVLVGLGSLCKGLPHELSSSKKASLLCSALQWEHMSLF